MAGENTLLIYKRNDTMSRICFKRICGKGVSGSGKETQMKQGWPTGWELSKLGEGTWGSLYYYSLYF